MKNLKCFVKNTIDELDGWIAENIQHHSSNTMMSGEMFTRIISDSDEGSYLFFCPNCGETSKSTEEHKYYCPTCLSAFGGRQLSFEDFVVFKHYKDSVFISLKVDATIRANYFMEISIEDISVSNSFAFKLDHYDMIFYDLNSGEEISLLKDKRKSKKYTDIILENNLGFFMNYYKIPSSILIQYNNVLNLNSEVKNLINPIYTVGEFIWKEALRQVILLMSKEDFAMNVFESLQHKDPLLKYKSYIKEDVDYFKDIISKTDLYKTDTIVGDKMSGEIYCSKCNEISRFNYVKCDKVGNGSVKLIKDCCDKELETDTHFQFYNNEREEIDIPIAEYYAIDGKLVKFIYRYRKVWEKEVSENIQIKKIIVYSSGEGNVLKMNPVLNEEYSGSWVQIINTENLFRTFEELKIKLSREEIFDALEIMRKNSNTSKIIDTPEDELKESGGIGYITIRTKCSDEPVQNIYRGSINFLYFILSNPGVLNLINYKNLKKLMDTNFIEKFSGDTTSIKALTGFDKNIFNLILSDERMISAIDTIFILNKFKPLSLEEITKLQEKEEFINAVGNEGNMFNMNLETILNILSKYEEVNSFRVIKRIIDYSQKEYLDLHSAAFNYREYLRGVDNLIETGYKNEFDFYPKNIESMNYKVFEIKSFLQQDNYRFKNAKNKIDLLAKESDMELFEIKTFEDLLEIEKSFRQPISFFKKTDTSIMLLKTKGKKKALLAVSLKQRVLSFSNYLTKEKKNDKTKGILQFVIKNGEISKPEKDFITKFFNEYDVKQNCIL